MAVTSDSALVRNFKKGQERNLAFDSIVKKYQEPLYWHIRKIVIRHEDADDCLQNTFIKAYEGLDHFREDAKLYTWLYRIATNEALSYLKKAKNIRGKEMHAGGQVILDRLHSDPFFDGEKASMALQEAIARLPEKQRIVFNMKYFDEMKYQNMAEILETSVGALKASYHHAVKKIEEFLDMD